MCRIEPRAPVFHNPQALWCGRGITGDNHSAPLLRVCRAVPADDEAVLGLEEIRSFIEHDQVMRITLESLLVGLLFTAGYINLPLTQPPSLELPIVAGIVTEDCLNARFDLHRVFVDAPQEQGSLVFG